MKFSISAALFAVVAIANAAAVEQPEMAAIRRNVLLLERAGANNGRPVASGNCCVPNTSKKEDVCTTAAGEDGKCVPEGAQVNCGSLSLSLTAGLVANKITTLGKGALNCIASSLLTCDANVLENGRPTCRL